MHRALVVVFLLCLAWSQAFAAECPALPQPDEAEHTASVAAHAAHPPAHHDGPAPAGRGAHHADTPCAMSAACGLVAPPAAVGAAPGSAPPPLDAHRLPASRYTAPLLGTDPPPPRPA